MAILVDSSVWIASAHSKNKECKLLKDLIEKNKETIYIALPIQVEVCQGARTHGEFERLWDAFLGFDFLEIEDSLWAQSAWNYFQCKKRGIITSTIDCLIATLSHAYHTPLWTLDKHFKMMQPVIGFELFQP